MKNAADVPAGYNLGAKTQMNIAKTQYRSGSDIALYIDVASSVTVSDSGDVSLSNATRSNISLQSNYSSKIQSSVRGKFVTFTPVRSGIVTTPSGIYFIPSDATVSYTYAESGNPVFAYDISAAQTVTGYPLIPAGTTTTYPVSTNPNAYQEGDDAKEAGYTLGEVETGSFAITSKSSPGGVGTRWNDSSALSVSDDGTCTLATTGGTYIDGTTTNAATTAKNELQGKFAYCNNTDTDFTSSVIVFFPSNTIFTKVGNIVYADRYQPVTGYAAIPASTTIEYLGKLGDKARVQVVSYVGTGTYGESNPNSLTFNFAPKIVKFLFQVEVGIGNHSKIENFQQDDEQYYMVSDRLTTEFAQGEGFGYNSYAVRGKKSADGKTFTWYTGISSQAQGNQNGMKYYFIAFG